MFDIPRRPPRDHLRSTSLHPEAIDSVRNAQLAATSGLGMFGEESLHGPENLRLFPCVQRGDMADPANPVDHARRGGQVLVSERAALEGAELRPGGALPLVPFTPRSVPLDLVQDRPDSAHPVDVPVAGVPRQPDPPTVSQHTGKLAEGAAGIEPVKGLGGAHGVERRRPDRHGLGRSGHHRHARQESVQHLVHRLDRFHGDDGGAGREQEPGELAGSGGQVSDDGVRPHPQMVDEPRHGARWVRRPRPLVRLCLPAEPAARGLMDHPASVSAHRGSPGRWSTGALVSPWAVPGAAMSWAPRFGRLGVPAPAAALRQRSDRRAPRPVDAAPGSFSAPSMAQDAGAGAGTPSRSRTRTGRRRRPSVPVRRPSLPQQTGHSGQIDLAPDEASTSTERGSTVSPCCATPVTVVDNGHSPPPARRAPTDARESAADARDAAGDERDTTADDRESRADARDKAADAREKIADEREAALDRREAALDERARHLLSTAPDQIARSQEGIRRSREGLARSGERLDRAEASLRRIQRRNEQEQATVERESRAPVPPSPPDDAS